MPEWQAATSMPACCAWPGCICSIDTTMNMRIAPASWHHTPFTPDSPALSISSQIMPDCTMHLANETSVGGRIGDAMVRIGSLR